MYFSFCFFFFRVKNSHQSSEYLSASASVFFGIWKQKLHQVVLSSGISVCVCVCVCVCVSKVDNLYQYTCGLVFCRKG